MSRHPRHAWALLSRAAIDEDLVIQLHPDAWPDRVATVTVNAIAEVFIFSFGEFRSYDFAYDDVDRPDVLKEWIDRAVAVTSGPTRIILESAGGATIRGALWVDPDGPIPGWHQTTSYPLRRLKARLKGLRATREVMDLPAATKA